MVNDVKYEVNAGFFDAIDRDRLYSAEDMNRPYRKLISNGVFATPKGTPSDNLQVFSANDEMNIIVFKGEAIIGDKWFENPSNLIITIPQNSKILTRIDSIVAQIDKTQAGRVGNIVYRQGAASSNPVHPDINAEENIIEFRLADIRVSPSCVKITQDLITDCRGSEECPWITSLIYQVDTSTLYAQWQEAYRNYFEEQQESNSNYTEEFKLMLSNFFDEEQQAFTNWFNSIKENLSEDAAGNLLNQLDELTHKFNSEIKIAVGIDEPKNGEEIWLKTQSENLFDETQMIPNAAIDEYKVLGPQTGFNVSNFIKVKKGDILKINFKSSGLISGGYAGYKTYCFYDDNQEAIKAHNYDESSLSIPVTADGFFRISYNRGLIVEIYNINGGKILLKDGDTYTTFIDFNDVKTKLDKLYPNVYSTKETRIGTTEDGRGVYRRRVDVADIKSSQIDKNNTLNFLIENLDYVKAVSGGFRLENKNKSFVPWNFYNPVLKSGTGAYYTGSAINYFTSFAGTNVYFELTYVKTTE